MCLLGTWTSSAYAADPLPTGIFVLPFNENQSWELTAPDCAARGVKGYVNPWDSGASDSHQYHMEWNDDINQQTKLPFNKYHMGEDWNGRCGGSSDLGAPLFALGDGIIQLADSVGVNSTGTPSQKGKRLDIRYAIPYAKGTGGVAVFDMVYLHLNSIMPGIINGTKVARGQELAAIGGSGGWPIHLHWELQWDKNLARDTNDYQPTLTKTIALNYRAPSLIVDDRRDVITVTPSAPYTWSGAFSPARDAPSSTAYVSVSGLNKSLKQAIAFGWMKASDIQYWDAALSQWRYMTNVDDNFFRSDTWYVFAVRATGGTLNIPLPGNHFQDDRARLDMINAVKSDARFKNILTQTFTRDPNVYPGWIRHCMDFTTSSGIGRVCQVTGAMRPLVRQTIFRISETGAWSAWKEVDKNELY